MKSVMNDELLHMELLGFAPVQEVDNLSGGQCSAVARKDAEVWNNSPHINTLI